MKKLSVSLTALALWSVLVMAGIFAPIPTATASQPDTKIVVPVEPKSEPSENQNILTPYEDKRLMGIAHAICGTQIEPEVKGLVLDLDEDGLPDAFAAFRNWDNEGVEDKPFGVMLFENETLYLDENRDGKVDRIIPNAIGRKICEDIPSSRNRP